MKLTKYDLLFIIFAVILAAAIRADFLLAGNIIPDADEAIVGLMAKHMNDGAPIPTFYYGQHYMGSLEAILASISFQMFGVNSFALKLVPLLFSLLLVPLMYLIGLDLEGKRTACLAALFMALPPAPLVIWSAKARGGFIETLFFGALAIFLTIRWIKTGGSNLLTISLGIILGLAWWTNNQIIYFIGPVGLFLFLASIRNPILTTARHFVLGAFSFLIGSLPFWIYNFHHNFISFEMFGSADSKDVGEHLEGLLQTAFPMLMGSMRFWQPNEIFPGAVGISFAVYIFLSVLYVWSRKREILKVFLARVSKQPVELLAFFMLWTCFVFIVSSFGWLVQAPRYLLPLYVGISLLFGYTVSYLWTKTRIAAVIVTLIIFSFNLGSSYLGGRAVPGEPFVYNQERVSRDHSELIAWLKTNNIHFIHTNYWIGYRLAFETNEEVKFAVFGEPGTVRIKSYEKELHGLPSADVPYVVVNSEAPIVGKALELLGYHYQKKFLSGYVVLKIDQIPQSLPKQRMLDAKDLVLSAYRSTDQLKNVIDNDLSTRWGTGEHQAPGQNFHIKLVKPESLKMIILRLGEFRHDYPRRLEVYAERENGEKVTVMSNDQYEALKYFDKCIAEIDIPLPNFPVSSLTLVQTGTHPILDWSIAELEVWK